VDGFELGFDDDEIPAGRIGLAQREGIVWHADLVPDDG